MQLTSFVCSLMAYKRDYLAGRGNDERQKCSNCKDDLGSAHESRAGALHKLKGICIARPSSVYLFNYRRQRASCGSYPFAQINYARNEDSGAWQSLEIAMREDWKQNCGRRTRRRNRKRDSSQESPRRVSSQVDSAKEQVVFSSRALIGSPESRPQCHLSHSTFSLFLTLRRSAFPFFCRRSTENLALCVSGDSRRTRSES